MGKSLAEASGQTQGQDFVPDSRAIDPQLAQQGKKFTPRLWIAGMERATPRKSASAPESSCWQNLCEANKPRFTRPY